MNIIKAPGDMATPPPTDPIKEVKAGDVVEKDTTGAWKALIARLKQKRANKEANGAAALVPPEKVDKLIADAGYDSELDFNLGQVASEMMGVFNPGPLGYDTMAAKKEALSDRQWNTIKNLEIGDIGSRDPFYWGDEGLPLPKAFIEEVLYPEVTDHNLSSTNHAWSAATVSYLINHSVPEADKDRFRGSAAHVYYVIDAFQSQYNPSKYRYNLFKPVKINKKGGEDRQGNPKNDYKVGDILWHPRGAYSGWSYKKMKKAMVNTDTGGTPGKFMTTHGDVIVGVSTDEDGTVRYHMMGGNKSDTLFSQDMTAEEMTKKYLGHLSRQDRPAE